LACFAIEMRKPWLRPSTIQALTAQDHPFP
jgi:hypothetical protein